MTKTKVNKSLHRQFRHLYLPTIKIRFGNSFQHRDYSLCWGFPKLLVRDLRRLCKVDRHGSPVTFRFNLRMTIINITTDLYKTSVRVFLHFWRSPKNLGFTMYATRSIYDDYIVRVYTGRDLMTSTFRRL